MPVLADFYRASLTVATLSEQALAASGEPQRQGEALLALLRSAAAGHGHAAYFGAVTAQCMTSAQHKLVRRLAYSFLRSCQGADGSAEWVVVREAVLRDVREQDPELAAAAIAIIPSLPLQVLQPAAANIAISLTAILATRGDAASESVRRSAVQGARCVLLSLGDIKTAANASDPEIKALHSLALALAACALESSRLISSEAMEALAALCVFAPASSRPIGAPTLGHLLCMPYIPISILEDSSFPSDSSGSSSHVGSRADVVTPATRHIGSHGALGSLPYLASAAIAWLLPRFDIFLARFMSMQVEVRPQSLSCVTRYGRSLATLEGGLITDVTVAISCRKRTDARAFGWLCCS